MRRKRVTTRGNLALEVESAEETEETKTRSSDSMMERVMGRDSVLRAAVHFGKRLEAGEVRVLSKEEGDRELEAIRREQMDMRNKIGEALKK